MDKFRRNTHTKKYDIEHVIYSDEVNKLSVRNVSNLYYEFSDEYRFTDLLKKLTLILKVLDILSIITLNLQKMICTVLFVI